MADSTIDPKKIQDNTFYLESISCTEEDLQRIAYLEKIYTESYPNDAPFNFSKTISKAVAIAYANALNPKWGDLTQKRLEDLDELDKRSSGIGKFKRKKSRRYR
jgi:hypothetical protein